MIQALQPSKSALGHASETGVKNSNFGAVLSKTITATNVSDANVKLDAKANVKEQLQSLIEFLQIEDLSELEDGKQLGEELLFATQDEQVSVIFDHAGHVFSAESLEELQNLLSELTAATEEEQDILQQLIMIVNQAVSGAEPSQQRFLAAEEALKLAKIYTLFKNVLDLSDEKALKLDDLKQKLEQIVGKLEPILDSKEKNFILNRHHTTALMSGQIHSESSAKIQSVLNSNGETKIVESTHNPFMNMSKLEQFVLNTQSGQKGTVNSEQMLKSFENIISRAQFTNNNGMQKLLIKLNPEHLGSLRVEIIQQNGVMIAKIIASTSQAKELLDSQLQGLKQAFVNQNIPVEKLELSQQFTHLSQDRHLARDQGQQQDGQTNSEQSQDDNENMTKQFQTQFEEALLEAEV